MKVIETIHLFPVVNDKLVEFLKSLSADDWKRQTVAKKWLIKDVASHLLDGNFRRIAMHRDGWFNVVGKINSYADLVNYLNEINSDWVKATKRLSPQIIIDLLEQTNSQVYEIFLEMDPFSASVFPVDWAGESESKNWLDIAREYTERWHHQQQIRDAMNDNGILTKELYWPLLNIFMLAWPQACKEVSAPIGTVLKTKITGECGGDWYLVKNDNGWQLSEEIHNINSETIIDASIAWKLFSKSIRKEEVKEFYSIQGDQELGATVLNMVSVMA
ncbi:MAG: maleylpyruvate isomerase N-terminal domain-containing protein [Chitinophagaceae bacterium]